MLQQLQLDFKDYDSGVSKRSQLEQVWDQTGIKPKELEIDFLPEDVSYLREIFWDLWDGEGIKWSEIYFYQEIMDLELDGEELILLKGANSKCANWMRDKHKPKKPKSIPKTGRR